MKEKLSTSGFTAEQIASLMAALDSYEKSLEQKLAGNREGESERVHGTLLDDLCDEEIAKYRCHPLDLWVRLEQWCVNDEMATGLDQFLLRHLGFFNVEPASPGYMVRLRLPACQVRGDQMQALADIAERYAGGYCHVTTRGNIQLREIAPRNLLNVISALTSCGLSCQGSGADSARNITTSPAAGFDASELIDLAPYARRLSDLILHTRELRALPRKFNISFDNAGTISAVSDSNDVCFQAVQPTDDAPIAPGIYCRIGLGGISGHRDLTRDTGFVCTPEQTVLVGMAILTVFVKHADRTNRKRARLKYLLDKQGLEWFVAQVQSELESMAAGFQLTPLAIEHDLPRLPVDRMAHIGVHPQREPGYDYLGLALEMGRLEAAQMRMLGEIAQSRGRNELRLTVWQNVLIPWIDDASRTQTIAQLLSAGLSVEATAFAAGAVACTGKTACKLGLAHTKEDGLALVRHLQNQFSLDQPINIHLTGCPNSCAQHLISDIGLLGTTLPNGEAGYHLVLGGGSDQDKGIGRPVAGPIPATDLNDAVERVVGDYLSSRSGDETFLEYVRRLSDDALPSLIDVAHLAA